MKAIRGIERAVDTPWRRPGLTDTYRQWVKLGRPNGWSPEREAARSKTAPARTTTAQAPRPAWDDVQALRDRKKALQTWQVSRKPAVPVPVVGETSQTRARAAALSGQIAGGIERAGALRAWAREAELYGLKDRLWRMEGLPEGELHHRLHALEEQFLRCNARLALATG